MKNILIECAGITSSRQLHETLAAALSLPDWYGHNLDALYDCLTELGQDLHLSLKGFPHAAPWAEGFLSVFHDAAQANSHFSFTLFS